MNTCQYGCSTHCQTTSSSERSNACCKYSSPAIRRGHVAGRPLRDTKLGGVHQVDLFALRLPEENSLRHRCPPSSLCENRRKRVPVLTLGGSPCKQNQPSADLRRLDVRRVKVQTNAASIRPAPLTIAPAPIALSELTSRGPSPFVNACPRARAMSGTARSRHPQTSHPERKCNSSATVDEGRRTARQAAQQQDRLIQAQSVPSRCLCRRWQPATSDRSDRSLGWQPAGDERSTKLRFLT